MTGGLACGAAGHHGPCVGMRGVFGWATCDERGEKKMGRPKQISPSAGMISPLLFSICYPISKLSSNLYLRF
jgi:hypothetical protein